MNGYMSLYTKKLTVEEGLAFEEGLTIEESLAFQKR